MFDTAILKDKIGYEKWVLRESILAIEKYKGIKSEGRIKFQLDGIKTHYIQMYEEFGAGKRVEILEKLSPLIFVTSYKVLDMIFEWILKENGSTEWEFAKKIKAYEILSSQPNFLVPSSIKSEIPLLEIFFKLYKNLAVYRNQLIHGSWGRVNNGNLLFSFRKNRKNYNKQITFTNVLNLAEAISLFAEEIIVPSENQSYMFSTVKYLLDRLKNLHAGSLFNINMPRHFNVEYEISTNTTEIEMKVIKDHLYDTTFGNSFSFSLVVTSNSKTWEFSWNYIKSINKLKLDSSVDKYLI